MRISLATLMVFACGSTAAWADARADCANDNLPADPRITACSEIIRGDAKAGWAYLTRGVAYRAKGDVDRAIADYTKAFELDHKSTLGYIARGNAYRAKGDLVRASADYNKAIEMDPESAGAYTGRGNVYLGNL